MVSTIPKAVPTRGEGRSSALRKFVYQRDGGVCIGCGCDTELTQKAYRHALEHLRFFEGVRAFSLWQEVVVLAGFHAWQTSWWHADHVLPLSEGGADTLNNLRTLCIPCHRQETSRLRKRLAKFERLRRKSPRPKYQVFHLTRLNR